jgi:hypothetical protein
MSQFFFFLLGCGLTATGCWLRSSLQELGTLTEHDEHEDM